MKSGKLYKVMQPVRTVSMRIDKIQALKTGDHVMLVKGNGDSYLFLLPNGQKTNITFNANPTEFPAYFKEVL